MMGKRVGFLLVGVMLLFAACAGPMNQVPGTLEGTLDTDLPVEAVLQAQIFLSEQLGVTIGDIEIVETEQVEWQDACLGLGLANESCAQVVTPGWRVTFDVNGDIYELRTDDTGSVVRAVEDFIEQDTTQ